MIKCPGVGWSDLVHHIDNPHRIGRRACDCVLFDFRQRLELGFPCFGIKSRTRFRPFVLIEKHEHRYGVVVVERRVHQRLHRLHIFGLSFATDTAGMDCGIVDCDVLDRGGHPPSDVRRVRRRRAGIAIGPDPVAPARAVQPRGGGIEDGQAEQADDDTRAKDPDGRKNVTFYKISNVLRLCPGGLTAWGSKTSQRLPVMQAVTWGWRGLDPRPPRLDAFLASSLAPLLFLLAAAPLMSSFLKRPSCSPLVLAFGVSFALSIPALHAGRQ